MSGGTAGGPNGVEPRFVGASRIALVDGLVALAARVNTEARPQWVSLEAPSGWGKTRVARELYARLAQRQPAPPYWPPTILDSSQLPLDDVSSRRKRVNPEVMHNPGSLPSFAWWGISCAARNGVPSVALAQDVATLQAHAPYLEDAWLRLPRSSRLPIDARDFLATVIDEAAMEVGGRLVEAALGTAVPGLGLVRWAAEWGWGKNQERLQRRDRLAGTSGIGPDHRATADSVVEMLARLARPGLPLVLFVEDLHDTDAVLLDVLSRIVAGNASVLVITTGWPGHLEESDDLMQAMTRAGDRLLRISSEHDGRLPAPFGPAAGLHELEPDGLASVLRHYYPEVDDETLRQLIRRYPNPLALELFCQIPIYRRRFASRPLRLSERDVASLPATIRDLYRRLWEELPQSVRQALAIATLGIPAVLDPKTGRSQLWNTGVMADALTALELPDGPEVSESLRDAPTAYAWARVVTDILRRFVEPDQLSVAAEDRDQFLFPDEVDVIKRAVAAQLAVRLTGAEPSVQQEREHAARLLLALHAEGFVSDDLQVTVAATVLLEVLRDDPSELSERLRLADLGLRYCSPTSVPGFRLRSERIRALSRLDRVAEALGELTPLREDLDRELGPRARAVIEMDAEAAWLMRATDPVPALRLARSAAERATDALGTDDRLTLQVRNILAACLDDAGRTVEAVELDRDILARRTAAFGESDRETLLAAANYAVVLRRSGRLEEAGDVAERTCRRRTLVLGPTHPDTLRSQGELATIRELAGRPGEALTLRRSVVEASRAVLGPTHPDTLDAVAGLAAALGQIGQSREAVDLAQQRLVLTRQSTGDTSPASWDAESDLAALLDQVGLGDRALRIQRDLTARITAALGEDHPRAVRAAVALTGISAGERGAAASLTVAEDLVARVDRLLPPEHPLRLAVQDKLGYLYRCLGRYEEAAALHEEVLAAHRRHQPDNVGAQASDLIQLSDCWLACGATQEGIARLSAQLEACRLAVGDAAEITLQLRLARARLVAASDAAAGVAQIRQLEDAAERDYPVAHPYRIQVRLTAVRILTASDPEAAETQRMALLTDLLDALGPENPRTLQALRDVLSTGTSTDNVSDRLVGICLQILPAVREQVGPTAGLYRQLLQAASTAVLGGSRDGDVLQFRAELVDIVAADPEPDAIELGRARALLAWSQLQAGDDAGMETALQAVQGLEPVAGGSDAVVISMRRILAIYHATAYGEWDRALEHRLAVLSALRSDPDGDQDQVPQARQELAATLAASALAEDHPLHTEARRVLAERRIGPSADHADALSHTSDHSGPDTDRSRVVTIRRCRVVGWCRPRAPWPGRDSGSGSARSAAGSGGRSRSDRTSRPARRRGRSARRCGPAGARPARPGCGPGTPSATPRGGDGRAGPDSPGPVPRRRRAPRAATAAPARRPSVLQAHGPPAEPPTNR